MIEETKIQRAFGRLINICAASVVYLCVIEPLLHIAADCLQLGIHPAPSSTNRMPSVVAIITVVATAHGGTKAAKGWIDYRKMRDCKIETLTKVDESS